MMRAYSVGTRAYIDSFNGFVPCVVVAVNVDNPYNGDLRKYGTRVTVKVTRTGKGYVAGELVTFGADTIPPRVRNVVF